MSKRTFEKEWEELRGEGFTMVEIVKLLEVALRYELRRLEGSKDDQRRG